MDLPALLYLNSYLPSELRHEWRHLFSSGLHGENFSLLVKHIIDQGPTILVLKDNEGHIFGGFASHSWAIRPQFVGKILYYVSSSLTCTLTQKHRYSTPAY